MNTYEVLVVGVTLDCLGSQDSCMRDLVCVCWLPHFSPDVAGSEVITAMSTHLEVTLGCLKMRANIMME